MKAARKPDLLYENTEIRYHSKGSSRKHTPQRLPLAASGKKSYARQMVRAFCRSVVIHAFGMSVRQKKSRSRVDFISTAELAPSVCRFAVFLNCERFFKIGL